MANYVTDDLCAWTATRWWTWADLFRRIPANGPLGLTRLRYEEADRGE